MIASRNHGSFLRNNTGIFRTFSTWFPLPRLLMPRAAGVDISDTSIKWIVLEGQAGAKRVYAYGREELPAGAVVNGVVQNTGALVEGLRTMREKLQNVDCAHAALPEEDAFVFNMTVPEGSSREQILSIIEFELEGRVPIAPGAAVYDFDRMQVDERTGEEIGVVVFPRERAEVYANAFTAAGINLLSLEVEASSIARAVGSHRRDEPITLLVDFGRSRTGFAVLKQGIPIFTSTVGVGGDTIDKAISEKLGLSDADARKFKNEQGLLAAGGTKSAGLEALSGTASALADEVARHYHYWDTRRNERGERMTPVEQVLLVGGSANLRGLSDYIAGRVQSETTCPNVWRNVCSFEDYIPPISREESLQYATAIGLALRNA